jgi:hypothetical protein
MRLKNMKLTEVAKIVNGTSARWSHRKKPMLEGSYRPGSEADWIDLIL